MLPIRELTKLQRTYIKKHFGSSSKPLYIYTYRRRFKVSTIPPHRINYIPPGTFFSRGGMITNPFKLLFKCKRKETLEYSA